MDAIKVFRGVWAEDTYGDPKPPSDPSTWPLWKTFDGAFGPSNPSEPLEVGTNKVITGGEVYIRGTEPTGILATDQVEIGGQRFNVDGDIGPWNGYGGYKGDQFAVKATKVVT